MALGQSYCFLIAIGPKFFPVLLSGQNLLMTLERVVPGAPNPGAAEVQEIEQTNEDLGFPCSNFCMQVGEFPWTGCVLNEEDTWLN